MNTIKLFIMLSRKHIVQLTLGIFLFVIAAVASLGLLALSGWFITATALASFSIITASSFNFFTPGAGVRGFSMLRTVSRYFARLVSHNGTFHLISCFRQWFFERIVNMPILVMISYRKGDLLNRMITDIQALEQLYLRLLSPFFTAVMICPIMFGFLYFFYPPVAFFTLIVMLSWIIVVPLFFYFIGKKTGKALSVNQKKIRQSILDHIQGMTENKLYGYLLISRVLIAQTDQALCDSQKKMVFLEALGTAFCTSGAGIAVVIMFYISGIAYQQDQITGPVMAMLLFSVLVVFENLMPLAVAFQSLFYTNEAIKRLDDITGNAIPISVLQTQEKTLLMSSHNIVFKNVNFAYEHSALPLMTNSMLTLLHNLSFNIPLGTHCALLGKSGSGKSTFIYLLMKMLMPTVGDIYIGNQALKDMNTDVLYQNITCIPQDTHVFNGTLRDNLLIANSEATDAQLLEVVKKSELINMGVHIRQQDNNILNQSIGLGGISLSGGEKRRLAAARALLKPAPILIMDEPTEGLDFAAKKRLLLALFCEFQQSTIIVVTHNKTVLPKLDIVYQLRSGSFIVN